MYYSQRWWVAINNYMFRPSWRISSGCITKVDKLIRVQYASMNR